MQKVDARRIKYIFEMLFDTYGSQNWWPAFTPFEISVGAILVQNTMWRNVKVSINSLEKLGLLEPYRMYIASPQKVATAIKPSGFPRLKTDRLKNFLKFFEQFSFDFKEMEKIDTPSLRKLLLSVNGIGKETADSLLLYIFNRPILIVDAYTKRFFSRLGYPPSLLKEDKKMDFANALENKSDILSEFHALIVQHSKAYCKAKPICEKCPLSDICEFGGRDHE